MKNQEVAKILYDIADLLEIKGELVFKFVAYRRAAQAIESLSRDIEDVYRDGKLDDVNGVGPGIAKKVVEYLETGRSKYLNDLKKGLPPGFGELLALEGVGPKKVKLFLEKKIKNLKELEAAAKAGKLRNIPTLGEKTEKNILHSIESAKKRGGRMLLGHALLLADEIMDELKKNKNVVMISSAGSLRRMKETIGDIDVLVTSANPGAVIEYFTKMKNVSSVIAQGSTKASVRLKNGIQADLRVLPEREYGSALMYFTGSKEHNIELRRMAIAKKMKLSEYGLFSNKFVAGRSEEEVYRKLGLQYIEPEMRESRGEIELAKKGKLPKIVRHDDVIGDLHMHSTWSDGKNTIEEMALAAKKLGYEYICIADHIGHLTIANALDKKRLEKQRKEIGLLNKELHGITILQGGEVDIRADGRLDMDDQTLEKLDIVLASLHSSLKAGEERNTKRIIGAMENPHVDIIAHPSGRLIDQREGSLLNMEKIIDKAKETNTILEVDAQPNRLDMNDVNVRATIEHGCKIAIDTDAHNVDQLRFMNIGVGTARRGWATKKDVINTYELDKMMKLLK
ncbi:MAG: DNA polymerase/3'-5' exonuclease PolX [Candidatus Aenigmatarchaeota archaeon]